MRSEHGRAEHEGRHYSELPRRVDGGETLRRTTVSRPPLAPLAYGASVRHRLAGTSHRHASEVLAIPQSIRQGLDRATHHEYRISCGSGHAPMLGVEPG